MKPKSFLYVNASFLSILSKTRPHYVFGSIRKFTWCIDLDLNYYSFHLLGMVKILLWHPLLRFWPVFAVYATITYSWIMQRYKSKTNNFKREICLPFCLSFLLNVFCHQTCNNTSKTWIQISRQMLAIRWHFN